MTNEQIVKVLAEREGWKYSSIPADGGCFGWVSPSGGCLQDFTALPDYITSIDALRPVLAKLSGEEWSIMEHIINMLSFEGRVFRINLDLMKFLLMKFLLTISPEQLAAAIAESIVKAKG